jgi:hypothetical protein
VRFREIQIHEPQGSRDQNLKLSAVSEAITLGVRACRTIDAPFRKLVLVLRDPPTPASEWVIYTPGIGVLAVGSRALSRHESAPELNDQVAKLVKIAFDRLLARTQAVDEAVAAVESVLSSDLHFKFDLFRLQSKDPVASRPRVVYEFSDSYAGVHVVDMNDRRIATLVEQDEFVPGDLLISARKGYVRDGKAILCEGSGKIVASVPLEMGEQQSRSRRRP